MLVRKFFTPIKNRARKENYRSRSFKYSSWNPTLYLESDTVISMCHGCYKSQEEIYLQKFRQAKFEGGYHESLKDAAWRSMLVKHRAVNYSIH